MKSVNLKLYDPVVVLIDEQDPLRLQGALTLNEERTWELQAALLAKLLELRGQPSRVLGFRPRCIEIVFPEPTVMSTCKVRYRRKLNPQSRLNDRRMLEPQGLDIYVHDAIVVPATGCVKWSMEVARNLLPQRHFRRESGHDLLSRVVCADVTKWSFVR